MIMKYKLNSDISNNLSFINDDTLSKLNKELNDVKSLIDNYPKEWEIVKRQIHEYEYIYTSSYYKKNISYISPISRSYFKFREIYNSYPLLNSFEDKLSDIKILCLAEAPGGFIQSILDLIPNEKIDKIHGITLISEDSKIPSWNHLIRKNKKVQFHTGGAGNGDLYDFKNVLSFIKDIQKSSVHLITGDGGFDNSSDYSKQEEHSLKLIYSEIFMALNLQKRGGSFVCKIFDTFKKETIILLYILRSSYNEIYIHKPKISRLSNSEKYITCIDYKGYNHKIINLLCHNFNDNKLNIPIDNLYISDMISFNSKYCKIQMDHIHMGINIIMKNKLNKRPTKEQIELAIEWCKKYNIQINDKCIFLRFDNHLPESRVGKTMFR